MYIAGADFAARKYENFIEVSGIRGQIENAEKNIAAVNDFLHHNEQQRNLAIRERDQRQREEIAHQQQEQAEARNGRLTLIGLGLAVIASFSVIPSMWIDFYGGADTTSIAQTFGISYGVSQFLLFVCTGFVLLSISVSFFPCFRP